ncbi:MAG: dTMP kinase [Deltaproteobacteria bacterium]|nr:dTMP kinase [Deltaproteobacteria bacterium]
MTSGIKKPAAGTLISFEGIEGCGKSTQIALLAERLRAAGKEVVLSREPGATPLGLELRKILLDPVYSPDSLTELLLYLADRREHCRLVIAPALQRGALVLVDRYVDSTWVYQGFARDEVETSLIERLNRLVVGDFWPQLTFVLDCPADRGLERARQRNLESGVVGVADRFEQRHLDFHSRVRQGFLVLADVAKERFRVIDADREIAMIHNDIWQKLILQDAVS